MPLEDWPDPIEEPQKPMDPQDPAFVITCVGWHTRRVGNEGLKWFEDQTRLLYGTLIHFLQDNGLTTREILPKGAFVADETAIRRGDLTEVGKLLMRRPYDRWLGSLEKKDADVTNTRILERALKKIRTGNVNKYGE